jgi:release factor glutamine methyltransferase
LKSAEHFREGYAPKSILDIGTGSGAIIISVANMLESRASRDHGAKYFASDISSNALLVAKTNAENLDFAAKIDFKAGDLFEPWRGQTFDMIVTNLPYVPEREKSSLAPDLLEFEPHSALFGGVDGFDVIRDFLEQLPKHLNENGKVFMEIGHNQGAAISDILSVSLPKARVQIIGDYANIDRIVIIEK